MLTDIRDLPFIGHADVIGLNFVSAGAPYVFRRHYRSGLRSHVMELLDPADVERESHGVFIDGVRWFPRAVPLKMLRIFRRRFSSLAEAHAEVKRVKLVETCLGSEYMAVSEEFLVDYAGPAGRDLLLCGLQQYVAGDPVDPWRQPPVLDTASGECCGTAPWAGGNRPPESARCGRLRDSAAGFVERVKGMVRSTHLIPDLAGARNIIATSSGRLKLVDINNISAIRLSDDICIDDKGYPVCDKSVEALFLLEQRLVGRTPDAADPIYAHFLAPVRMRRVAEIHRRFHGCLGGDAAPV